jgi:uncharacterized protein (TIGR02145 family)
MGMTEVTRYYSSDPGATDMAAEDEVNVDGVVWADTNMDVSKFRGGARIPEARSANAWEDAVEKYGRSSWCHYENDKTNCAKYGKLYFAPNIDELESMCPAGWRIPTYVEWCDLMTSYGVNFFNVFMGDVKAATSVWEKLSGAPLRGVLAGSRDRFGKFIGARMVWAVRDGTQIRGVGLRIDGNSNSMVFLDYTSEAYSVRLVRA